jgi:hypothetical protein
LIIEKLEIAIEDDLVDFFGSEDFIDGVGVEETEVVVVDLELAGFYPDDQVGEHLGY